MAPCTESGPPACSDISACALTETCAPCADRLACACTEICVAVIVTPDVSILMLLPPTCSVMDCAAVTELLPAEIVMLWLPEETVRLSLPVLMVALLLP